jgi:hypothetical protein
MNSKQAPGGDTNKGPGATGKGTLGGSQTKVKVGLPNHPVPGHTRGKDSKSH